MSKLLKSNLDPEDQAYIYQQIEVLEPFLTDKSEVTVVEENFKRRMKSLELEDADVADYKKKYRYCISITIVTEEDVKLKSEGFGKTLIEAVKGATTDMVKTLTEIQEEVITTKARNAQIYEALKNKTIH